MANFIRKTCLAVLLSLCLAPPALARDDDHRRDDHGRRDDRGDRRSGRGHDAPEFDIAAAGVVVALAAGGGIVLARRRKK